MQNKHFKTILFLLSFSFNGYAQNPTYCTGGTQFMEMDINNVRTHFRASGGMFYDNENNDYKYEVPKGSGIQNIITFDYWMSAIDEFGQKRIDYQWYSYNGQYYSGPLSDDGFTSPLSCQNYDRVWKINKSTLDSFKMSLLPEIPRDILEWPAKENPHISFAPQEDLAPFIDVNNDQIYNPLDGDYPEILGDQALWWVFNDVGANNSFQGFLPLQCDVQVMAYAYNSIPELENHTFYKYTLTNKAVGRLDSVMLGMFLDTQIGNFLDDLVGCDTLRNMGITYNGDDFDWEYGENSPMLGLKLLQGPQKKNGSFADMYSFWYRSSGPFIWDYPFSLEGVYNALWGLYENGLPMRYGGYGHGDGDGKVTLFKYPSDPTDENGWSECSENHSPSDRTMFMSVGPFSIERLEQKELHFAILWVQEDVENPCPSFAPIQEAADYVQNLFDNGIITNIEENSTSKPENTSIHLFPNPATANTVLYLEQKQALQKGALQLFDSLGRLVKNVDLKAVRQNQLQLLELQSGIYFYQLQWEKGGMENGKLMVQ